MLHEDDIADHPHDGGGEGNACAVCRKRAKTTKAQALPIGARLVICKECLQDDHRIPEAERRAKAKAEEG